mmetsp:Transcript_67923/g.153704  ORF Transcript_67923/g.153704 Transcript_67923/m.153704 type:complete len:244 (-) Transcript_67923:462-1193(-)
MHQEVVHISGKGGESRRGLVGVARFEPGCRAEERVELVVLHVDGKRLPRVVSQLRDGTRGLARPPRHAERVHVVGTVRAHTQHGHQGVDHKGVCVLEEEDPILAVLLPTFGEPRSMHEVVHVAVAVGFGLELPAVFLLGRQACQVVVKRWDLVLHEHRHLGLGQAEALLALDQGSSGRVRVPRRHDGKGHLERDIACQSAGAALESKDPRRVHGQKAAARAQLYRQFHLDTAVAKTLAESPSD